MFDFNEVIKGNQPVTRLPRVEFKAKVKVNFDKRNLSYSQLSIITVNEPGNSRLIRGLIFAKLIVSYLTVFKTKDFFNRA